MKKRIFAIISALMLCVTLLAACGGGPVNAEQAQKIALEHVGRQASQVSDIHTHVIEENGIPCFQIHMTTDNGEVTVLVDASNGEVIENG